ncbi:9161_t:CDS:2, partial [Cetraspora pellucida]
IDTDDLYETEVCSTSASDSQDVLQVSDDNDNMTTSTATASDRNIVSLFTPVTPTKKAKSRSSVSPYFSQRTIDNMSVLCSFCWNMTKLASSQQLLTFTPEMIISSQSLTLAQKTKLYILIAKWIVSNMLPLFIISSRSFATMLQYLNANVDLPSCETIKSIIQNAFIIMQKNVKTLLEQAPSKISVTLDIWTSHTNVPFLCIIAHWINNDEEIDTHLHSVFAAFKITDKILCATTNTHILNLIVMSSLLPIKSSIKKVCNVVKTISSSSSLTQDLKELGQSVREGEATRKILQDVST